MNIKIKYLLTSALISFLIMVLTSCGKNVTYYTEEKKANDSVTIRNEGVYYFKLGGIIEVEKDSYGRISITHLDELTSENANQTFAMHPRTNLRDVFPNAAGKVIVSKDILYTSGHDIEADNNANIVGLRRTDFIYSFSKNKIKVHIKIFSAASNNNVNYMSTTRKLIWRTIGDICN